MHKPAVLCQVVRTVSHNCGVSKQLVEGTLETFDVHVQKRPERATPTGCRRDQDVVLTLCLEECLSGSGSSPARTESECKWLVGCEQRRE